MITFNNLTRMMTRKESNLVSLPVFGARSWGVPTIVQAAAIYKSYLKKHAMMKFAANKDSKGSTR